MDVFKGNKKKSVFQKGYTAKKNETNKMVIAHFMIENNADRAIFFEININEYLFAKYAVYSGPKKEEEEKSTANVAYE
jgi:hypothetical protein